MAAKVAFTKELYIVDFLIVIYAVCYQLQAPLEPYLVDRLVKNAGSGDAAASYATLQSFFSLVQMVGSLFVGALIDRLGLRAAFILNFIACGASYSILSSVENVNGLYMSKLPTVFMTGFLCAQTAVVKLTQPGPDRVSQLGRLTMAYTIGGTVGPSLGGYLGTSMAARFAVLGSIGAALLVLLLPSKVDNQSEPDSEEEVSEDTTTHNITSSWLRSALVVVSITWPFLLMKFVGTVANSMHRSMSPLIFKDIFLLSEAELGAVMSAVFFGTALVSMLLGLFIKWIGSEHRLIKVCVVGLALGYTTEAILFHPNLALLNFKSDLIEDESRLYIMKQVFTVLSFMLAFFQFPLATTITSQSTSLVSSSMRGTLVGIEHSLFALAGICGPTLGVHVMKQYKVTGVAQVAAAGFVSTFFIFATQQHRLIKKPKGNTPLQEERKSK